MDQEFHIYGYSENSKVFYPENTPDDFTIHLQKSFHLEGEWECGLIQFQYAASLEKPFFVCCDLVNESYVGDIKLPILRRVRLRNTQFNQVIYSTLKKRDFNSIRIYMKTWRNKPGTMVRGKTYYTLHFRRVYKPLV